MKLLKPSELKFKSEILGNEKAISNYFVNCEIKDWECRFLNVFEFFMKKFIPVRKLTNVVVETNDPKILVEVVRKNTEKLFLTHDCPLGEIKLSYEHRILTDKPVNIRSDLFKYNKGSNFSNYCNNDILSTLGSNKRITITGEIEETIAVLKLNTSYNLIRPFRRTGIFEYNEKNETYENAKCFDYEYNKGYFEIEYQDSRDFTEIYKLTKKLMLDFIKNLKDNIDIYGKNRINELILYITNDQSLRIANLIFIYIYSLDPVNISYNITEDVENNGSTIKLISEENFEYKKKILLEALDLLMNHISII